MPTRIALTCIDRGIRAVRQAPGGCVVSGARDRFCKRPCDPLLTAGAALTCWFPEPNARCRVRRLKRAAEHPQGHRCARGGRVERQICAA